MSNLIVLAGATGNLGYRILKSLVNKNCNVTALVRSGTSEEKLQKLQLTGVTVFEVKDWTVEELTSACIGASCVVSALQGLEDVIVDAQTILLKAAVNASVPRFIPSDFSLDFTTLTAGENRNFDLRRKFHDELNNADINATSIFNGAFAEILTYNIPVLDYKKKTVGYWQSENTPLDFTTMDDTAAFTAAAAMDSSAPRYLHIASFRVTPNDLAALAGKISGTSYPMLNMGSLTDFAAYNRSQREANPEGEKELNPRWQSGQYMHDMFSAPPPQLDNDRFTDVNWIPAEKFLSYFIK